MRSEDWHEQEAKNERYAEEMERWERFREALADDDDADESDCYERLPR